ncbi:MAG: hypothetical protein K6F70_00340 [Eggerthellaceae bacterium]|nr:hypothetical protein [Eggerthellaceae bacterium]
MEAEASGRLNTVFYFAANHPWIAYFVKAAILVSLLVFIAFAGPSLPPIFLAFIWAIVSTASAIGVAYHNVIKKVRRSFGLKPGGQLYALNNGRIVALALAFVISAACFASLFISLPSWSIEWLLVPLAIALFPLVFTLGKKWLAKEYEPVLLTSMTIKVSTIIVTIVLAILFIAIGYFTHSNATESKDIAEIFFSTNQPFLHSPSILISDLGCVFALADSVKQFEEEFIFGLAIVEFLKGVAISYSIANLIALCATSLRELRNVFLQLQVVRSISPEPVSDTDKTKVLDPITNFETIALKYKTRNRDKYNIGNARNVSIRKYMPLKRFVAATIILPIMLIGLCIWTGYQEAAITSSPLYSQAKNVIRDKLDVSVFTLDGKTYNSSRAKEIYEDAITEINAIKAGQSSKLTALITAAYGAYEANADSLMLHYYGDNHDFLRDESWTSGITEKLQNEDAISVAEQDVRDNASFILMRNADTTTLNEQYETYKNELAELEATLKERYKYYNLEESAIDDPQGWIVKHVDTPIPGLEASDFATADSIIDAAFRVNGLPSDGADLYHDPNAVIESVMQTRFAEHTANKLDRYFDSYHALFSANDGALASLSRTLDNLLSRFEQTSLDISDYQKSAYRQEIADAIHAQRDAELARVNEYTEEKLQEDLEGVEPEETVATITGSIQG